ncbi:GNAT family N-acetyltransferase [Clostridium manihotivorum]|uniref:GNAT family N-acetyltransferase n=1 Tax=Clostridium manihotivorum TaxID=2320868 RepID=A0A410DTP5_9CLOT|nr:GNAT family N-acetyltransferase [Clostridium manihotivorum]QAA32455.1 GNAT family N-acetyltransferase [Clostridium manihotivorum]
MLSKAETLNIAKKQLILDYNLQITDFENNTNTIVEKKLLEGRRLYDNDDCFLKILCMENKAFISTEATIIPWFEEFYGKGTGEWFFNYPNLRRIDNKLKDFGHEIADCHHYYLPIFNNIPIKELAPVKWYEKEDILQFRGDDRFDEAFAFNDNFPDMLGVAAFDGEEIIGMAGASADCESMWQIGINVMPDYTGKGIATYLVRLLKEKVYKRGKIPFYGTAESHINSQNVAIKSGFLPAWAELYTRKIR